MNLLERAGLAAMHQIDPEVGHGLAIKALQMGLCPKSGPVTSKRLKTSIAGLDLPNPIGLAAGLDKNAAAIAPLLKTGFGFIEVGAATPKAQSGNPKPRLFRLKPDQASINRFGFNNDGMDAIATRLSSRSSKGIVGLNMGANKASTDRADDYVQVLQKCAAYVDFLTVNVSSPNTEKLRDLQGTDALNTLLSGVMQARADIQSTTPVFVKIAPDLETDEIAMIAEVAMTNKLDAIIATNTTLDRGGLSDPKKAEAGGLSGAPLFEKSTRILAQLANQTNGNIPLIGVGGVSSAEQAYAKVKAGASAIQLYTALVYHGFSLARTIAQKLDLLLEQDGFTSIQEAVGTDIDAYL